jgi:hypothetical protein
MVWALRVFIPGLCVESNGDHGIMRDSTEEICNHPEVARELDCPMWVKETYSRPPCSEDTSPVSLGLDCPLGRRVLLFDQSETSGKVLRLILVIVASAECRVQFLEVHKVVLDNEPPDCAGQWIDHGLQLHDIDDGVERLIGPKRATELARFFNVRIGLNAGEELRHVGSR